MNCVKLGWCDAVFLSTLIMFLFHFSFDCAVFLSLGSKKCLCDMWSSSSLNCAMKCWSLKWRDLNFAYFVRNKHVICLLLLFSSKFRFCLCFWDHESSNFFLCTFILLRRRKDGLLFNCSSFTVMRRRRFGCLKNWKRLFFPPNLNHQNKQSLITFGSSQLLKYN